MSAPSEKPRRTRPASADQTGDYMAETGEYGVTPKSPGTAQDQTTDGTSTPDATDVPWADDPDSGADGTRTRSSDELAFGQLPSGFSFAGSHGGGSRSPADAVAAGGSEVPGYELLDELGRGGMGVVYKAREVGLNRLVALKMVLRGSHASPTERVRFLAEAEAVAAVRHPNVVQLYGYGQHEGQPYFALELLEGGSLAGRLKKGGAMPARDAAAMVEAITRGVQAAHDLGIVHRDLKPANVLLDAAGNPKVTDFGLAKRGAGADVTATGAVMGTPAYMSPEQAKGGTKFVGPGADIYALGVILYECLTGDLPFKADDTVSLILMVADAPAPSPRTRNAKVPRDLELVCLKCLEKEPHRRYATAKDLADDLARYRDGRPVTARPVGAGERAVRWVRRNPAPAALLGVVGLVTLGLAGSLVVQYRQAVDRAAFERKAKEEAETLATANARLATAESERRAEAVRAGEEAERARVAAVRAGEEAEKARAAAAAEAVRANQVSDFMAGLFRSSDPLDIFGKDVLPANYEGLRGRTARDFLDAAVAQFETGLTDQPLVRAKLLGIIGSSYRNLGEFAKAGPLLKEAQELRRKNLPPAHPDLAVGEIALGQWALDTGDFLAAEERFTAALVLQKKAGADPKVLTVTRTFLGWAMCMLGRNGASGVLREELDNRVRLFGPKHLETLSAKLGLAAVLLDEGDMKEAMPLVAELLAALKEHPDSQLKAAGEVMAEFQKGVVGVAAADSAGPLKGLALSTAETALKNSLARAAAVLPPGHVYTALIRHELGECYVKMGDDDQAEIQFKAALDVARKTTGVSHPKVLILIDHYARLLRRTGRAAAARELFEEVLAANQSLLGPENHWRALILMRYTVAEAHAGNAEAAARHARAALAQYKAGKLLPTRQAANYLLGAAQSLYRYPAHAALCLELYDVCRPVAAAAFGEVHPDVVIILIDRGSLLLKQAATKEQGLAVLDEAIVIADKLGDKFSARERFYLLHNRGLPELQRARHAAAEPIIKQSLDLARKAGIDADERREALLRYAWALAGQGKYAAAADAAEQVVTTLPAGGTDRPHALSRVAILRLAAGDRDGAAEALRRLAAACGDSTDPLVYWHLARAWSFAPPDMPGWDHDVAACRLVPGPGQTQYYGQVRARAMAHLRAGVPALAADVIRRVKPIAAVDHLILGLAAAASGNAAEAKASLAEADRLVAAAAPSKEKPFAHTTYWFDRVEVALLRAELAAAIEKVGP